MRQLSVLLSSLLFILTSCTPNVQKEPYSSANSLVAHAQFVGAQKCKECHQEFYTDWEESDHAYAMQKASPEYVKAHFDTIYEADEIKYKFYKEDTAYFVDITQNDTTKSFKVAYTFGWRPLQQYLLETEKGKFQTLRASWNTEKNIWFHQNQGTIVEPHDWLSWSKGGQNWNTMCSSCHSTHLKKNYNQHTDSFKTTYEEINVACESCHGQGGAHVVAQSKSSVPDPYLVQNLNHQKIQVDRCGTCHARRTMLEDNNDPDNHFLHRYIPQNLTSTFYEADGQIDGEDFVYGSFLSSKMYRNHVKCSNCHDPHSLKLKKQGNELCLQCHEPNYDTPSHHHHAEQHAGTLCVNCHMDGKTYMGNDYRRDHSFRIPRPDQSVQYGTSNACNSCHKDKNSKWASDKVRLWYGEQRAYHFSDDLLPASELTSASLSHLKKLLLNDSVPEIIQATAVEYLRYVSDPKALTLILKSSKNEDALVRQSAYASLLSYPNNVKTEPSLTGLKDPVKSVRVLAVRNLIHLDASTLNPEILKTWNKVNAEYLTYLTTNSDFPSGQTRIGEYYQQQGDFNRSVSAYKRGLKMDSLQLTPYSNLAISFSEQGESQKVQNILKQGLSNFPNNAELHYYTGLNEATLGNSHRTLHHLKQAYQLEPGNFTYSYNYILTLYNSGNEKEAKNQLTKALATQPSSARLQELNRYFNR